MPSVPEPPIDAGPFGAWLAQMRASLQGHAGTQVPCGECVGCCVSSYYIPIRPEDAAARARIPDEHLAIPSNQPDGLVIRYLDDGTCPMLQHGQCTIYEHRPQTCRDYDCRVFAAAGIDAGPERPVINRRVHAWRFTYPSVGDRREHDAVLAAAAFIRARRAAFPGGRAPTAPTGIAVLAVKVYRVFLDPQLGARPVAEIARAIIDESRGFDAGNLA